jgi:hypothetical protein
MFRRAKSYVVIQENVPPREERAIERAVVTVLPPVQPSQAFVQQLGADLLEEARRQREAEQQSNQTLRIFGMVGGGLLSVIGGMALWLLTHRPKDRRDQPITSAQRRVTATAGTA